MPQLRMAFLTVTLLTIAGCSLFGVSSDLIDRGAFVGASTYSWKSPEIEQPSGVSDTQYQLDQKVRAEVNRLMSMKGYQLAKPPTDLYTDYQYKIIPITVAQQPDNAEASISFSKSEGINTERVNEGTSKVSLSVELSIDVYDQTNENLAYSTKATNQDAEHKELGQSIDRMIRKAKLSIPKKPN